MKAALAMKFPAIGLDDRETKRKIRPEFSRADFGA